MYQPKKEFVEYRFDKQDNPKLSITITTDKDNRITDIRNPFRIQHPFRVFYFLHKRVVDKWKETNGLIERGRITYSENLKGSELMNHIIKNSIYYSFQR